MNPAICQLVALDLGKNVHVVGTYHPATLASTHPPFEITNTSDGLARLSAHLDCLLARPGALVLGHEPTGVYYEAFGRRLQQHYAPALDSGQLSYVFVNPYQVKLARKLLQRGRQRKSDPIDTEAIAYCLQHDQSFPAQFASGQRLLFEQWANRYRHAEREKRDLRTRLLSQMDRLWPGAFVNVRRFAQAHPDLPVPEPLVETRPLERKLVQTLLNFSPNPHDLLSLSEAEVLDLLRGEVGRASLTTVRKVLRNARQSLLPPPEVAAIYAQAVTEDWTRYQQLEAQQTTLIAQAETLVPQSEAAVLLTVPGMSAYHAARYLAAIGAVQRFPAADHLWAFAGFDPVYEQSGDGGWVGRLSKKGDPAFRDTLFLIGQSMACHCPVIRQAFDRAYRLDRKRRVLATLHAAHKANRMLFHLLQHQENYDATEAR